MLNDLPQVALSKIGFGCPGMDSYLTGLRVCSARLREDESGSGSLLMQIDWFTKVLRDSHLCDIRGAWSMRRQGRCGSGTRVSIGLRIGLYGSGYFFWRRDR